MSESDGEIAVSSLERMLKREIKELEQKLDEQIAYSANLICGFNQMSEQVSGHVNRHSVVIGKQAYWYDCSDCGKPTNQSPCYRCVTVPIKQSTIDEIVECLDNCVDVMDTEGFCLEVLTIKRLIKELKDKQ